MDAADRTLATLQPTAVPGSNKSLLLTGDISALGAVALVVNIAHDGFTSFARRLPIQDEIFIDARLQPATPVTVMPSQSTSISGATVNGFTVSLTDENDKPEMTVSIPASSLPSGTSSLSAAIKTYDPNNPQDAQFFPGSYADSTGNNLVSVAFNYAEIKTSSGESLKSLAQASRAARQAVGPIAFLAPPEPVIINRAIPTSSCAILENLGDANTAQSGFQIPVYSYNATKGLWDLLGYGTVYLADRSLLPADAKDLQCETRDYVLEIAVTNEIFLSDWWNLDYPLQFSQPKKMCGTVRVLNEQKQVLAGVTGIVGGTGGNAGTKFFVTDNNGEAHIELEVFASVLDSYDANIWIWSSEDAYGTVKLSPTCPDPTPQVVEVKRPQLCAIKGHMQYESGQPASTMPIYAIISDDFSAGTPDYFRYLFAYSATNSSGNYQLDVPCNRNYSVIAILNKSREEIPPVNVNMTVQTPELTDNGKQIEMPNIIIEPNEAQVFSAFRDGVNGAAILFYGIYDSFPITYDLAIKNTKSGQIYATAQGSLTNNLNVNDDTQIFSWMFRLGELKIPATLPGDPKDIYAVGQLKDAFGNTVMVHSPLENERPDICWDISCVMRDAQEEAE